MQRLIVDIPDQKINFFMELLSNLGIKKVEKLSAEQTEFVDDLKESLEQVKSHQSGELELQSAREFLNEI